MRRGFLGGNGRRNRPAHARRALYRSRATRRAQGGSAARPALSRRARRRERTAQQPPARLTVAIPLGVLRIRLHSTRCEVALATGAVVVEIQGAIHIEPAPRAEMIVVVGKESGI